MEKGRCVPDWKDKAQDMFDREAASHHGDLTPSERRYREAAKVAQIEDDAFADECERDKVASLQQTDMW